MICSYSSQRLRRRSCGSSQQHFILLVLLHLAVVLPPTSAFDSPSIVGRQRLNMFAATRSCSRWIPAGARASPACSSRLFGTRRNTPGNPPGEISIYNEQTALNGIDIDRIEATMTEIRSIIKYPTYDISLLLVDDEEMSKTNLDTRGIDGPTDILSFPFQDVAVGGKPGELAEPEFDIEDYFSLGDMMLDVAYVMRRCEEDRRAAAAAGSQRRNGQGRTIQCPRRVRRRMAAFTPCVQLTGKPDVDSLPTSPVPFTPPVQP